MSTRKHLTFRYIEGPSISDDLLREIWTVRVEMLDLQIPPDEDWTKFSGLLRRADTSVFVFFETAGTAQGFFTISFLPVDLRERKGLLFFSKYFYFRKAYRGHYKALLAPWWLLPIAVRRFGFRSLHFVTSAFPQSFVSLSRTAGNVVSLGSTTATTWQKDALTHFARTFYAGDFDEAHGVVRNQNVVDTPGLPQSAEARKLAADYEVLNTDWREGVTLPILFSVDAGLVWHNLRRMTRRALPGRWRAKLDASP